MPANLDLVVDLCRMQVEGDLSVDLQGPLVAEGDSGTGADQGLLPDLHADGPAAVERRPGRRRRRSVLTPSRRSRVW